MESGHRGVEAKSDDREVSQPATLNCCTSCGITKKSRASDYGTNKGDDGGRRRRSLWWAFLPVTSFAKLLFLVVALYGIYFARTPVCMVVGPAGIACRFSSSACLVPRWTCADLSIFTRVVGNRASLGAAVGLTTRSDAMLAYVSSAEKLMETNGIEETKHYGVLYHQMKRTRKQSSKVQRLGEALIESIPETANAVELDLKTMLVHARALQRNFALEPDEIARVLSTFGKCIGEIQTLLVHEEGMWNHVYKEAKQLLDHAKSLVGHLRDFKLLGQVPRSDVLSPLQVTVQSRVTEGIVSTVAGIVLGGAAVSPLSPIFVPVMAVGGVSFGGMAHMYANSRERKYAHLDLATKHFETMVDTVDNALPVFIQSVEKVAGNVRRVAHELGQVRSAVGQADIARVKMIRNPRSVRMAISEFIGFLETGIMDMQKVKDISARGRKQLLEYSSIAAE